MEVINMKEDVTRLTKDELGYILNLDEKEIRNHKKTDLVLRFLSQDSNDLIRKMYKDYSYRLALHPTKVQELLNINPSERKRWTNQGKLIVDHYQTFQKWGKIMEYPMYDAYELYKISLETIESWRHEHTCEIQKRRKEATKKALETKRKNLVVQQKFYEKEWKETLSNWFNVSSELGATLQLAFWTVWVSRWAKEYQSKAHSARLKTDQYISKKELFYELKNTALKLLQRSPHTQISFYRPPAPNKRFNLQFCHDHYHLWCELREFDYMGKWDFFDMYEKEIIKCETCSFNQINDYYSLFCLSVKSKDIEGVHFSFHTPYPIGKAIFPAKETLEKIYHNEQEGLFRFGRTLFEEEKVIFKEKEVKKHFEEAIEKFLLYFPIEKIV